MSGLTKVALITAVAAVMLAAACGTDNNANSSALSTGRAGSSVAASGATSPDPAGTTTTKATTDAFTAAGFSCATGTLRSSGSTAQGKVMAQPIDSYNAKCGASINSYGGGGSGKGVADFLSGQTDFGGSDSPLKPAEQATASKDRCHSADAVDLPMVTGPIAIAYNLPGVRALTLTPAALSGIFGGTITSWDDPAIRDTNPGVDLPKLAISTVHRSEDSGTTDNFTRYLAAAGTWKFPGGKAWSAPGGTGAQGSDGVAKAVAATEGSVGYVEWGFAQQYHLAMAEIDNGGGPVALTAKSAGAAVEAAQIVGTGKDLTLKIDYATKTPGAYPIVLVTYELVCTGGNGATADLLKSFLGYAATEGQAGFESLGAAPLPASIQSRVLEAIKGLS